MNKSHIGTIACVALLALGAAGCGSWSPSESPQENLCGEVAELDKLFTEVAALPPTATRDDLETLRLKIEIQYEEVQKAGEDVRSYRADAVTKAYNDMVNAIRSVPSQGIAAAKPAFDQAAAEFNQARTQLYAADC